jgi:fructose-specific phosphotransferase system component IIB
VDIRVEGRERFKGMKVIEVPLQEAIKNAQAIFERLKS